MKQTIGHHPLSLDSTYQMREAYMRGFAALASSVFVVNELVEFFPDVLATNASEDIEQLGAGIADLSLPSENQGEYGLRLAAFTTVGFKSPTSYLCCNNGLPDHVTRDKANQPTTNNYPFEGVVVL